MNMPERGYHPSHQTEDTAQGIRQHLDAILHETMFGERINRLARAALAILDGEAKSSPPKRDFNECRHGNFDIYRRCGFCGTMLQEDRMAETAAAVRGEGREC